MAANSLLHSSYYTTPSYFLNSESSLIKFRTIHLGSKPRNLVGQVKWESESLSTFSPSRRGVMQKKKEKRGLSVVRCTAEGIERGLLIGGRGEAKVWVPERYKVVALLACVMCLCNADRVVMSVAVVPLAAKYGWSSAFLGIVQFVWSYLFVVNEPRRAACVVV